MKIHLIVSLLLGVMLLPAQSKEAKESNRLATAGGVVTYSVPEKYSLKALNDDPRKAPAIFIVAESGSATINITPLIGQVKEDTKGETGIKALLQSFSEKYARGSSEGKVNPTALKWPNGEGKYSSFTDKRMDPKKPVPKGKFLKVTIGVFKVQQELFLLRVFHNSKEELDSAFQVVKSLKIEQE